MSGPHDPSKKLITFWASDEEKAMLYAAAKAGGFASLAHYLRWIATTQPKPGQQPIKQTPKARTSAKRKK